MTELTLETVAEWESDRLAFWERPHTERDGAERHRRSLNIRYAALLAFARERLSETCATTTTEDANG